jgi:hypothetical protein
MVRIDHQFSAANRITGRFWNSFPETPAYLNPSNYLEVTVGRTWLNGSTAITDTHVLTPNLSNQLPRESARPNANQSAGNFMRTAGAEDSPHPATGASADVLTRCL